MRKEYYFNRRNLRRKIDRFINYLEKNHKDTKYKFTLSYLSFSKYYRIIEFRFKLLYKIKFSTSSTQWVPFRRYSKWKAEKFPSHKIQFQLNWNCATNFPIPPVKTTYFLSSIFFPFPPGSCSRSCMPLVHDRS